MGKEISESEENLDLVVIDANTIKMMVQLQQRISVQMAIVGKAMQEFGNVLLTLKDIVRVNQNICENFLTMSDANIKMCDAIKALLSLIEEEKEWTKKTSK